jgi:hypothetical protein
VVALDEPVEDCGMDIVDEDGAELELGLTAPGGIDELLGAVAEPAAPVVVSLPAVVEGVAAPAVVPAVVEALALTPVEAAPDHQSLDARLLGEAFR